MKKYIWQTQNDKYVCDECGRRDDHILSEADAKKMRPPLHDDSEGRLACRCTLKLIEKGKAQTIEQASRRLIDSIADIFRRAGWKTKMNQADYESGAFICALCNQTKAGEKQDLSFGFDPVDILCSDCRKNALPSVWDEKCKQLEAKHEDDDYDDRVMEG